ncbi:hypothetical protein CBB_A0052 [Clostridium botulinum Bf]|nr:hypothetical protein CBB_A0052 [Clostridium botulinum Bf]
MFILLLLYFLKDMLALIPCTLKSTGSPLVALKFKKSLP